jgi:hypothetical protein
LNDYCVLGWSGIKSISPEGIYWPIVPALDDDDDDCGTIGGMMIRGQTEAPEENLIQCRSAPH